MDTANDPFQPHDATLVRHEEQLETRTTQREVGRLHLRKVIDEQPFDDSVTRGIEHAEIERAPANADDSGEIETLPDGSVSIPVLEEQLVVEKRLVVRERIIVRKRVVNESEQVRTTLRREIFEVEADAAVEDRVHTD